MQEVMAGHDQRLRCLRKIPEEMHGERHVRWSRWTEQGAYGDQTSCCFALAKERLVAAQLGLARLARVQNRFAAKQVGCVNNAPASQLPDRFAD